jgi:hypothetical protein
VKQQALGSYFPATDPLILFLLFSFSFSAHREQQVVLGSYLPATDSAMRHNVRSLMFLFLFLARIFFWCLTRSCATM